MNIMFTLGNTAKINSLAVCIFVASTLIIVVDQRGLSRIMKAKGTVREKSFAYYYSFIEYDRWQQQTDIEYNTVRRFVH